MILSFTKIFRCITIMVIISKQSVRLRKLIKKKVINMMEEKIKDLEYKIFSCGGDYALSHSRRLIKLVEELACGQYYNNDIICFCSYTHDLGGFGNYAKDNVDHATRSKEVVEEFIHQYDFTNSEIEIISETILLHHTSCELKSFEAILFRDADALEFIGAIGVARDLIRAEKNLKKGISSIQNHRTKSLKNITLESSKKIAEIRIKETDAFIENFLKESYMEF